jgi:hypothetical protein
MSLKEGIMDPITLATTVIGIISPFVAKGAQEFVSKVGEEAFEKTKQLFSYLKSKWTGNDEAASTLNNFEKKPERYEAVLKSILEEQINNDTDFANELSRKVNDLKPYLEIIQKMKKGEDVVGVQAEEMRSGTVKVTQEIEEGKNVKGTDIKIIG